MATIEFKTITEEILDFLASAPSAEAILAFKISDSLDQRLHELLNRNSEDGLAAEERLELEEFLRMGQLMRTLKIKTQLKLAGKV
jgi:HKD family nuclease